MKHKKDTSKIVILLVLLIGAAVFYFIPKYQYEHRTIEGIEKPVQVDIERTEGEAAPIDKAFTVEGGRVEMTYLATYDIKGLVVYVDDYDNLWANLFRTEHEWSQTSERAMPRDLSIVWGKMAANANQCKWGHGYRVLNTSCEAGVNLRDSDGDYEISNNHIIVEDGELRDKLMRVKKRDYIEMKGYLVQASFIGDDGSQQDVRSSLSRADDGGRNRLALKTACEIIYITDLEWLD